MIRIFGKHFLEGSPEEKRYAVGQLCGSTGIAVNLLLFLGKITVGILSGSVSIAADALNNLSDASGSVLTLVGFRLASKPADAHHPFGHARFEYLSALAVSVMTLVIGLELGKAAVEKILNPTPVSLSVLTGVVLVVSVGAKLGLYFLNRIMGQRIRSGTLLAAAADSRNDCITTVAVLAAALIEHTGGVRVDGIIGLGVAAFILRSGWGMAKQTISPLLGESVDPVLRTKIVDYVQAHPKVLGYHDLMVHDYGPGRQYASLHVEMDSREEPLFCHEIIDELERECLRSHGIHLVIHYDPVVTDDPALDALREETELLLKQQDPRLSLHDFRMVPGRTHMNLVFDVALPADLQGREQQIQQRIENGLNREDTLTYHVKITFDPSER